MSKPASSSAALPIAYVVLRILIVVNWLMGAAILALLVVMPNEQWIMARFQTFSFARRRAGDHGPARGRRARPRRHPAELCRPRSGCSRSLLTVRAGDPFIAANAHRLQAIAWALLALQLLSLVIGAIGKAVSSPAHPVHLDAGFSISGWLAVILTFVLARVFAEGTLMREDLEGTV